MEIQRLTIKSKYTFALSNQQKVASIKKKVNYILKQISGKARDQNDKILIKKKQLNIHLMVLISISDIKYSYLCLELANNEDLNDKI